MKKLYKANVRQELRAKSVQRLFKPKANAIVCIIFLTEEPNEIKKSKILVRLYSILFIFWIVSVDIEYQCRLFKKQQFIVHLAFLPNIMCDDFSK